MSIDVFAQLREEVATTCSRFVKDLSALPDDKIAVSPGGTARPASDFAYEVAFVNRRFAARMRGDTPPVANIEGWIVAPEDFRSKAALVAEVEASVAEVLAAYDGHGANGLGDTMSMPQGEWTVFQAALFVARHMNYHDAQLNYIQSLYGDLEVHW